LYEDWAAWFLLKFLFDFDFSPFGWGDADVRFLLLV
jgi:hypothetical protein